MTETLFTPVSFGAITAANRLAMAPLTRNRADNDTGEVSEMHVDYYRQRAGAGLIITEAAQISAEAKGYLQTPGIHTEGQVAAWRKVTDAVHDAGGKIVIQLWHVGRISHTSLLPDGQAPVAPSAINAGVKTFTANGFEETSDPRALDADELPRVVQDYVHAAEMAIKAGFDGVEVHAANGYLIDQFLKTGSNTRTDAYGGSVENRARLLMEVMEAVTAAIGGARTGIRLSPFSPANGISDANPQETFEHVIKGLNKFDLAYLHMVEGSTGGSRDLAEGESIDGLRALFDGIYMANNGYDRDMALQATESGHAEMIAIGRPFIANPDLVERYKQNAELNEGDKSTYYGGGRKGLTDYPTLKG
ncbi:NADH-dependent flavin oxidoreductase, Oye family protein [Sulfitobacter noctilucae]|uniref:alkene reductase n=1 Tax=Sulfitobacter noctilucae TaxID=1342302 RepID=UPI00046A2C26|nr:alkene reductase [Sulfitobacter noctilucae]KIN60830.1 NADH-dependent flavin oxidoreductase, Oye family protein [Sulfitobacter noctilucae]